ncbi:hypothetical protein [Kitasatospora sp. A2-31]|uniref:hypothetical protein n=1 Tax=Kitasatospora sp. A2-31 TaxID=2916414 RepID=UPI001EEB0DCA|nr:hypothetical protein [Kitasatospora sp. A2-31]MCG6493921.1 hypothetical protein [Kitasatospora sp. A2-31]
MAETIDELEARLADLRVRLREATRARDKGAATRIRREMRQVEEAWESALNEDDADQHPQFSEDADRNPTTQVLEAAATAPAEARSPASRLPTGIPAREQAHQALAILGAPAAPKLIAATYQAFFTDPLIVTKLASLRRDEERSFASQGHTRPYYICAALTHDRLAAARGLLAVSTWPLDRRIVGPLSPRTDFLTHAVGVAEQIQRLETAGHHPGEYAWRLLRRFAFNIPGAYESGEPDPARVIAAARNESTVHHEADAAERTAAAVRARSQLTDVQQLFGAPLQSMDRRTATTTS